MVKQLARAALRLTPPSLIRAVGRWQFRVPLLRPVIDRVARGVAVGEGTIQHGVGQGLRFDAAGGFPGYLFGTTDLPEQRALQRHLRPGGVFYDVGANIGFYACIGARLAGPGGRVVAFEPFAESLDKLRANLGRNGVADRVTIVEAAAGAVAGRQRMMVDDKAVMNKLESAASGWASREGPTVDVVTIDARRAAGDLPPPTVVMIDVEGAEVDVMRGMADTVAQARPAVLVEVHYIPAEVMAAFDELFRPHGYTWQLLGDAGGGPAAGWPAGPVRFHAVFVPPGGE